MRSGVPIVAALALSLACAPAEPPDPAAATALEVLALARSADPQPEDVDALFGPDDDGDRRAALFDALAALRGASSIRVVGSEPLSGLPVTAVDLLADLPEDGQATVSVHVETDSAGHRRVTWLAGPGVAWPPRSAGPGNGLSTSMPPTVK